MSGVSGAYQWRSEYTASTTAAQQAECVVRAVRGVSILLLSCWLSSS